MGKGLKNCPIDLKAHIPFIMQLSWSNDIYLNSSYAIPGFRGEMIKSGESIEIVKKNVWNFDNQLKFYNSVEIVRFGWNFDERLKLWLTGEIVKIGWNCEIWGWPIFGPSYVCSWHKCPSYIWCYLFLFFLYMRQFYFCSSYIFAHIIFVLLTFGPSLVRPMFAFI